MLGGDAAPVAVAGGVARALAADSDLRVAAVGPVDVAERSLAAAGAAADRLEIVAASQRIEMGEDPARAIRAKRDATVRVAVRLVRDGAADACVSVGPTGAAMAAALFTLGRLAGVTRPALAVVIPARNGPVVLLDAGAGVHAGPDLLAQFALAGAALAQTRLHVAHPRVGLLSVGTEPGKGDEVRKEAFGVLTAALDGQPAEFVGNVEGADVALGERADVIVTDGFTGNVLIKGMEGMLTLAISLVRDAGAPDRTLDDLLATALGPLHPDTLGGGVLLGVDGVVVIGHGAAGADAVASCIRVASAAVREGLLPRLAGSLDEFVRRRRAAAGYTAPVTGSDGGKGTQQ
jgi:phosphate acyltransferase